MRKALSDMTAQDLFEHMAALGLNRKGLASALGKHTSTISNYLNGRFPIPQDVAQIVAKLVQERAQQLHIHAANATSQIGQLIAYHNQNKTPELHRTEARLLRKQGKPDTSTYPVYRMNVERMGVLVSALAAWQGKVRELAQQHGDEARQRDYALELADIKAIVTSLPRSLPYDVVIQRNEWDVISRALRHWNTPQAIALYQHWRRYKGCGFPPHRRTGDGPDKNTGT